ncbi:MAG: YafY family transcriptional regulator [Myxococcales bacterium]|nr:YafY family transcriptional regulator [Myxococcales bacterium]
MRRADRLFLLIQALRGRRTPITAERLAEALGVSKRTIYRDVVDLQTSGVPIEGEAGVGYVLRKGGEIPPLMFERDEIEALVVGARFVRAFAGERLHAAARRALIKIEAVLPDGLRRSSDRSRVYAPKSEWRTFERQRMDDIHAAISERRLVTFTYVTGDGELSERTVEPICLAFWGHSWTLGAYCRLRAGFRNFRLDRIESMLVDDEPFEARPERGLDAFLESIGAPPGDEGGI